MSFSSNILEHETLLQSLSLEDKLEQRWNPPVFAGSFEEDADAMDLDDDAMDIDDKSLNGLLNDESLLEPQKDGDDEVDTNHYSEEKHHNLLALLSPTMMGARLAITHKPKLLMPPSPKIANYRAIDTDTSMEYLPSRTRKSSIDYEFDVSSFPTIKNTSNLVPPRNTSTLYNMPGPSLFASGSAANSGLTDFINQNPTQPQPQMIHHHHYYMNGSSDHSQVERVKGQYFNQLKTNKLREEELDKYLAMRKNDSIELTRTSDYINLPAPWRGDIHPIEKVPYMISSYLQLFINFIISLYFIYLVYYIVISIKSDVNHKIHVQKRAIQAQIDSCRTLFYESKCDDPEFNSLPILRKKCETLALGMNQDPNSIGNLSMINAQIIGLILNSLVEPLGFKFFMFLLWCGIVVFGCNFVFGFVRAKTYYGGRTDDKELIRKVE